MTSRIITVLASLIAVAGLGAPPATAQVRHIELEGAVNVRDLGGYRTYDGKTVRYGRAARPMENPDLLIPLQEVRGEYLDVTLDGIERRYGGFGRFLTRGLELDAATIVRLRRALVG